MKKPPADLVALIDAVKESPDDDAPRLVLADWLEEHGGDEGRARAELIRTQCGLSRALAEAVCPDDPEPLHALLRQDEHHGGGLKFHFNPLLRTEPRLEIGRAHV